MLPALTHIMAQHELRKGDGPIALILAPTHELAEQIAKEARLTPPPISPLYLHISPHELAEQIAKEARLPPPPPYISP